MILPPGERHRRAPSILSGVSAIALNTFREAIRDRILYLLLFFSLLMIAASRLLSLLTVGSEIKIIKDLGLSAISVFGLLTSVFVGVSLVFKEIEKRTLYTLLTSPVRRFQFVVGKFAGLLSVLAMNVVLMGAALLAVVALRGGSPWGLVPAIVMIFMQLVLVTAFAVLFSTFTNPILAAVGTVAVYVTGQLSFSLELLAQRTRSAWGRGLCQGLHLVVPNLDRLDLKLVAVHELPIDPEYVGAGLLYAAGYCAAVLVLSCVVFERRDFN